MPIYLLPPILWCLRETLTAEKKCFPWLLHKPTNLPGTEKTTSSGNITVKNMLLGPNVLVGTGLEAMR